MPLRVVSYNIRFGGGQRVPLLAKFLTALEPDVVVLQEATDRFAFERLAMMTGLNHTRLTAASFPKTVSISKASKFDC